MTFDLFVALTAVFLLIFPVARATIYRRQSEGIDDVVLFARKLNVDDIDRLNDPAEEWQIRISTTPREFRRIQRRRLRLHMEYLSRAAHNGQLVQAWSYRDHALSAAKTSNPADPKTYELWELLKTATQVRAAALVTSLSVGALLLLRADLWPLRLIPKVASLKTIAGLTLTTSYREMRTLAENVSRFYGSDWPEKLNAVL